MIAKHLFDGNGFALFSEFLLSVALLLLSGFFVTHYSRKISASRGWNRLWVGMMLLAPLSSAGEFISSISAITLLRAPDLALGGLLGSNLFNLMVLCFTLPVLTFRTPLISMKGILRERDILLSAWGIVLITISMSGIFLTESVPQSLYFLFSLLIAVFYLVGARLLLSYEKIESSELIKIPEKSTGSLWIYFLIWGAAMVFSGLWITTISDQIASYPFPLFGKKILLGHSFVGTFFLAIATSLDEMVIVISAIRIAAAELTIGTLFGSNLIHLFFISVLDIIYRLKYGVHIFFDLRTIHLLTGFIVIGLTAIATAGILYRSKTRKGFSLDTIAMASVYLVGMYLLFKLR